MTTADVISHLRDLLQVLKANDFSTKQQDQAVAKAIILLRNGGFDD